MSIWKVCADNNVGDKGDTLHILICPDSFKGSLSALEACEAMQRGIHKVLPEARCDLLPMADGGEGTVDALVSATKGEFKANEVRGPLGRALVARWGVLGTGATAVLEMAAASGLPLLREEERNPLQTCTYGTGELIVAALKELHRGVLREERLARGERPKLVIGIGGSATNDGGMGAARALGARFLDAKGRDLPPGGAALERLHSIDISSLHPLLAKTDILVACDVDNPLTGERGASTVFGPQKGATPAMVNQLDAALARYAEIAARDTGKDVARLPGAGAAGGLGAGLLFFTGAKLRPGIELVLETLDFDTHARLADLVLTGEGHSDFQTAYGKAPAGVAGAAKKFDKPVICISGGLGRGVEALYDKGIDAMAGAVCSVFTLAECMAQAAMLLENATERIMRVHSLGVRYGRAERTPG